MSDNEIEIPVTGMSCGGCASAVERALSRVAGVTDVRVGLAENRAYVATDGSVDQAALAAAVVRAGYGTTVEDRTDG